MNQIAINVTTTNKIDTKQIEKVILETLKIFHKNNCEVGIQAVSVDKIKELNKKFRAKNKATDVLSFPQVRIKNIKPEVLGDIVFCPEIVAEKGETFESVIKHGMLHLLGYDHETDPIEWNKAARKINCTL